MINIRKNVFETNSSSTHSICVTKNNILDNKITHLHFLTGEYGWECNTLNSTHGKASYLYTGILYNDKTELIKLIKKILDKNNITYGFEENKKTEYGYDNGYIDHGGNLNSFLEEICNDENKLMRYLFSSESFIITGNDNDDYDVEIKVDYNHDEYYKGN